MRCFFCLVAAFATLTNISPVWAGQISCRISGEEILYTHLAGMDYVAQVPLHERSFESPRQTLEFEVVPDPRSGPPVSRAKIWLLPEVIADGVPLEDASQSPLTDRRFTVSALVFGEEYAGTAGVDPADLEAWAALGGGPLMKLGLYKHQMMGADLWGSVVVPADQKYFQLHTAWEFGEVERVEAPSGDEIVDEIMALHNQDRIFRRVEVSLVCMQ